MILVFYFLLSQTSESESHGCVSFLFLLTSLFVCLQQAWQPQAKVLIMFLDDAGVKARVFWRVYSISFNQNVPSFFFVPGNPMWSLKLARWPWESLRTTPSHGTGYCCTSLFSLAITCFLSKESRGISDDASTPLHVNNESFSSPAAWWSPCWSAWFSSCCCGSWLAWWSGSWSFWWSWSSDTVSLQPQWLTSKSSPL